MTKTSMVTNTPESTNTPQFTKTPKPTNTPRPTSTPRPTNTPTATPDPDLFRAGTYLVNDEIKPGIYFGIESGCYWEKSKDLTGSFDSIIANANTDGQFYVEIKDTDYALSVDCPVHLFSKDPNHEMVTDLLPGQYLVGYDISEGTYKGNASSESFGCYWERDRNALGGFNSIIANDNATGQYYVEVKKSDFMLSTGCELNKVK